MTDSLALLLSWKQPAHQHPLVPPVRRIFSLLLYARCSPPDGIRFLPQEEDTIAEIHAEIKGPGERGTIEVRTADLSSGNPRVNYPYSSTVVL